MAVSPLHRVVYPIFSLPSDLRLNCRQVMEGREMMSKIPSQVINACFFDPQYRVRVDPPLVFERMEQDLIVRFIRDIDRILLSSGYLFLWVKKTHVLNGLSGWLEQTSLTIVDMIAWDKQRIARGYRAARTSEYVMVAQKTPKNAKESWKIHNIPDIWRERVDPPYAKPIGLQKKLIEAVTNEGDLVVDPAAGTFSVLEGCRLCGRNFLGCDIL